MSDSNQAVDRLVSGKTVSPNPKILAQREAEQSAFEASELMRARLDDAAKTDEFVVNGRTVTHKRTGFIADYPPLDENGRCPMPKIRGVFWFDGYEFPPPHLMSYFAAKVAGRFGMLRAKC